MSAAKTTGPRRILQAYYAATIVFLMLDYGWGLNVRIAGLQGSPGLRAGYYLAIFACLGLTIWRPAWSNGGQIRRPPESSENYPGPRGSKRLMPG